MSIALTRYPRIMLFALAFSFLLPPGNAQSISDLRSKAEQFHADSAALYRFDEQDLHRIWEAYCGEFDTTIPEDKDSAVAFLRQAQDKEKGLMEHLLEGELPGLLQDADKIQQNSGADPKDKDAAKEIAEGLQKRTPPARDLHLEIAIAIESGEWDFSSVAQQWTLTFSRPTF